MKEEFKEVTGKELHKLRCDDTFIGIGSILNYGVNVFKTKKIVKTKVRKNEQGL